LTVRGTMNGDILHKRDLLVLDDEESGLVQEEAS
jgi:hypothetical protein